MNSGSSKMESNLTSMWVSFFTAAGIPSEVAATYALTFAENRIQTDMLLDLNKEYLKDMGITRMGDVIAILRHAKQVHESTARERVLGVGATSRVPVAAVTGRATAAQPSSPASRILERYTRNPAPEAPPAAAPQKRKLMDAGANTEMNIKKTRLIRFGTATVSAVVDEDTTNKQTVFSRLGGNTDAPKSVAITKTVPKTVLVAKSVTAQPEPKTIFARLGAKAQAVTVKDQSVPTQKDALKYEGILKSEPPVFKKTFTVTTTKNSVRRIMGTTTISEETPVVKKEKVVSHCTMRADEVPVNIKEKLSMPKSKCVKFSNRVEYKEIEMRKLPVTANQNFTRVVNNPVKITQVFNKPERRLSMPVTADNSVKARLGMKNDNNLTIQKTVFNRLGV